MTIEQIADELNKCANDKCSECKYLYEPNPEKCKTMLIKEMGEEVKQIGQKMIDDRK